MELSERIKELRKGMGLTQLEMAESLRITKNHYWRIENGNGFPSISLLNVISEVTNTSLTVLLENKLNFRSPSAAYIAARRGRPLPLETQIIFKKPTEDAYDGKKMKLPKETVYAVDPLSAEKVMKDEISKKSEKKSSPKFNLEDAVKKNAEKMAKKPKKK